MTLTLVDVVARPSVVLLAGFAIRALLSRRSAAARHAVLAVSLFAAMAVIPLTSIAPRLAVNLPGTAATEHARVVPRQTPTVTSTVVADVSPEAAPFSRPSLAAIWISGMALGAALLAGALLRVRRIAREAELVRDPRWTRTVEALATAAGVRGPVALLQTNAAGVLATTGVVTAAPLLCFAGAANRISLTSLGLLQYIAPTLQFLLGVVVFDEPMPTARWVGFALVWFALAIFTVDSFMASRRRTRVDTHGPAVEAGVVLDADCLDERPATRGMPSAQAHPVAEPVGTVHEDR